MMPSIARNRAWIDPRDRRVQHTARPQPLTSDHLPQEAQKHGGRRRRSALMPGHRGLDRDHENGHAKNHADANDKRTGRREERPGLGWRDDQNRATDDHRERAQYPATRR